MKITLESSDLERLIKEKYPDATIKTDISKIEIEISLKELPKQIARPAIPATVPIKSEETPIETTQPGGPMKNMRGSLPVF